MAEPTIAAAPVLGDPNDPFAAKYPIQPTIGDANDPFKTPGVLEDMGKVAGPAALRGAVGLATGVPTIADLGLSFGDWLGQKVLPEGAAKTVSGGAKYLKDKIEPTTYGGAMKRIEDNVTGPLYTAKTTPGKYLQTAEEVIPSFLAGGGAVLPKLGRAVTGALASETAGELADKYLPEGWAPYARAAGMIGGAAAGPAMVRKAVTPLPATPEHAAAAQALKDAGMKLSAGAETGSPWALQREANLGGKKLAAQDTAGFTKAVGNQSGVPNAERLTPKAINDAQSGFGNYLQTVRNTIITPPNYSTLQKELSNVRKEAYKDVGAAGIGDVDNIINSVKLGPSGVVNPKSTVMGMTGGWYQHLRADIQNKIDNSSGPMRHYLGQMRQHLDDAMEKELPAGQLKDQHRQYANFQVLKKSDLKNEQVTPESLHKSIVNQWGNEAYNTGRGLSPLAHAGERVLARPEATPAGSGPVSTMLSTLLGYGGGEKLGGPPEALVGGILGKELGPAVSSILTRNPVTRAAYFNPLTQAYLKNQAWKPSAATMIDPSVATKLLLKGGLSPQIAPTYTPQGYPYIPAPPK